MKIVIGAFMVSFLVTGCGLLKKKPKVILPDKDKRVAGRIEQVNESENYVLIRRYGPWRFDVSREVVVSFGEGRAGNLLPTGEKLGEHIAADIRSGSVGVGDAVYIRGIQNPKTGKAETEKKQPSEAIKPLETTSSS